MSIENKLGPVFVVGVPRSGTTLLRLILNAHSQVSLGPETHFFKQVWEHKGQYGDLSDTNNLQTLWRDYSGTKSFDDFAFDNPAQVEKHVMQVVRDYPNFLQALLELYANYHHKPIWGEKTPEHLLYVPQILQWYPNAKIVHVIRDPRAVCASLAKVPWASNDVVSNARVWNRYLAFAEGLETPRQTASLLDIRYEDLIFNPEGILRQICAFIGIDFEPTMLSFYKESDKFVEKNEPWKNNVLSPMSADNIDKWKTQLSPSQQREVASKARRLMLKHGYLESKGLLDTIFALPLSLYVNLKWGLRRVLFHIQKAIST